ncbi:MAG: hypothetical protein ACO4AU_11700 [bacterium]
MEKFTAFLWSPPIRVVRRQGGSMPAFRIPDAGGAEPGHLRCQLDLGE